MTQTARQSGDEEHPFPSGWSYRAVVWSVLLSAAGYLGFAMWGGWQNFVTAVGKVGPFGICGILSLSLVNYGLRFLRWQSYLRAMTFPVPWWPSLQIYVAGFALTTTPAKAGEVLRSVLLKSWHVPYPVSLSALLSERLSDLVAVLLLALLGLTAYPGSWPLIACGMVGVCAVFLVVASDGLLKKIDASFQGHGWTSRQVRHLTQIMMQARLCHSLKLFAPAIAMSLIAWAAEACALYLVLHWMGADLEVTLALSVYAMSMLAGALSFMPGGLGGAEATMIALLQWAGVGIAESIATTVIIRIATLWFAVALGALSLIRLPSVKSSGPRAPALPLR